MFKNITTIFLLLIITFPAMAARPGVDDNIVDSGTGNDGIGGLIPENPDTTPINKCNTDTCKSGPKWCETVMENTSYHYCSNTTFNKSYAAPTNNVSKLEWSTDSCNIGDCTWTAQCNSGYYLKLKPDDYTTSCAQCSSLGWPYYNDPNRTELTEYKNKYNDSEPKIYITTSSFGDIYCAYSDYYDNNILNCSFINTDYPYSNTCSKCNDNEGYNSDKTGCVTCTTGTQPNHEGKCICNETGYFLDNDKCTRCGANSSSINPNALVGQTGFDNEYCICNSDYYYAANNTFIEQNNQNDCRELKRIKYQYKDANGTAQTRDEGHIPKDGTYTPINMGTKTGPAIIKEIRQNSVYTFEWKVKLYDTTCREYLHSSPLDIPAAISQDQLRQVLACNKDLIITPQFIDKYMYLYRKNNGNLMGCTQSTTICYPDDLTKCPAPPKSHCLETTEGPLPAGHYLADWTVYDVDDNMHPTTPIKDENGNLVRLAPNDTVTYPVKMLALVIESIQCEAGYYCTNGKRTKCPAGMTSEAGSDDITDCKTGDKTTKVCDDTGNCIPLPYGLTLRQK